MSPSPSVMLLPKATIVIAVKSSVGPVGPDDEQEARKRERRAAATLPRPERKTSNFGTMFIDTMITGNTKALYFSYFPGKVKKAEGTRFAHAEETALKAPDPQVGIEIGVFVP